MSDELNGTSTEYAQIRDELDRVAAEHSRARARIEELGTRSPRLRPSGSSSASTVVS